MKLIKLVYNGLTGTIMGYKTDERTMMKDKGSFTEEGKYFAKLARLYK